MVSKKFIDKYKLDEEEIELFKQEEKTVGKKAQQQFFKKAVDSLKKNKETQQISIRLNKASLLKIKQKASEYDLSYQTYINLFLNQLANDKFSFKIK